MWFYGQPRVPCTYLDKRDYVYGSKDKLLEALDYLQDHMPPQLLVIINTPGAALIGDDLERIAAEKITKFPFLIVETPGYSRHVWNGYEKACLKLLEHLLPAENSKRQKTTRKSVNLLGLSIYQKYYEGDLAEWKRLLDLAGMEVNCALCCDCTLDEIRHIGNADLNLVIDPAYGQKTAEYLQSLYGTPYIALPGVPIGFSACEELIRQAAHACNCDTDAFDKEAEKARARSYLFLSHLDALSGLPKGAAFAVHGTAPNARLRPFPDPVFRYDRRISRSQIRTVQPQITQNCRRFCLALPWRKHSKNRYWTPKPASFLPTAVSWPS